MRCPAVSLYDGLPGQYCANMLRITLPPTSATPTDPTVGFLAWICFK